MLSFTYLLDEKRLQQELQLDSWEWNKKFCKNTSLTCLCTGTLWKGYKLTLGRTGTFWQERQNETITKGKKERETSVGLLAGMEVGQKPLAFSHWIDIEALIF